MNDITKQAIKLGVRFVFNAVEKTDFALDIRREDRETPKLEETPKPPENIIEKMTKAAAREAGGDYCGFCPANKHFPKVIDALEDARNIYDREGKFTEVATKKIQYAVKELDGAEVDLEQGFIDPKLSDVVKDLRVQAATLRSFLRADHSALEIASENIRTPEAMKTDLDKALIAAEKLRESGYRLSTAWVKDRINIIKAARK